MGKCVGVLAREKAVLDLVGESKQCSAGSRSYEIGRESSVGYGWEK